MKPNPSKARVERRKRAAVLARLESQRLTLRGLLRSPPPALRGADVWDVLLRCPGLGPAGARLACERSHVWPHTQVGELKRHEVRALLAALPDRVR